MTTCNHGLKNQDKLISSLYVIFQEFEYNSKFFLKHIPTICNLFYFDCKHVIYIIHFITYFIIKEISFFDQASKENLLQINAYNINSKF